MTMLACDGVSVRAGNRPILERVELTVASGSLTVLAGPSGAGKTTLLRAVAGLAPVAEGSVTLAGVDVTRLPAHRRRVTLLFQEPRLFPGLDAADNVSFPLRLARVPRRRRRAAAAALLEEVGLGGYASRGVRGLSGGEAQRVALARALAANPDVLLLDEPLSALDPERRDTLRSLLRETQRRRHLTVLHVTHDQAEAAELADQLAVLLDGRVAATGTPQDLMERPPSAAVARFLGTPNLVAGRDGRRLAIRPQRIRLDPAGGLRLRVADSAYQGTHRRLRLHTNGLELEAHVPTDVDPAVGEWVGVDIPTDALWEVPA